MAKQMLKVLFAGSPDISVPSLKQIAFNFDLVGVLTNSPSAKGRSKTLTPTPVGLACEGLLSQNHEVKVLTPIKLDENLRNQVFELKPDILVCFAYGHIFGPKFMSLFKLGGINLHPSLLPKYRGCAPIPFAILNQEKETGFTVQTIAPEMDSGDIIIQQTYTLLPNETTLSLSQKVAQVGAELLCKALSEIQEKGLSSSWQKQDETKVSFCKKIVKEMATVDWSKSNREISASIRAFNPWPGAFTTVEFHDGSVRVLMVWNAEVYEQSLNMETCDGMSNAPGQVLSVDKQKGILVQTGDGIIALKELQWQSKKTLDWKSFINGCRDFVGLTLGTGSLKK